MIKFLVKGKITDAKGNPIDNLFLQAMDSNQEWFEDHIDHLLGSSRTGSDGSFEIIFDDSMLREDWVENNEIYLTVRNENGQIIHRTESIKIESYDKCSRAVDIPIFITLDSVERTTNRMWTDLYWNNERIVSAFTFSSATDTIILNYSDIESNFRVLTSSINAWLRYTNELIWKKIGYDGAQVPRYPWQYPEHSHRLSWEH